MRFHRGICNPHSSNHRSLSKGQLLARVLLLCGVLCAIFLKGSTPVAGQDEPATSAPASVVEETSTADGEQQNANEVLLPEIDDSLPLDLFRIGPAGTSTIRSSAKGNISSLKVRPGDIVVEGQLVATIDDQQAMLNWEKAWAKYRVLQLQQSKANSFERSASLADLKLATAELHKHGSLATHYGMVQQLFQQEGEFVEYATPLISIMDQRAYQIRVPIRPGQLVTGTSLLLLGEGSLLTGRVVKILPGTSDAGSLNTLLSDYATAVVALDYCLEDLEEITSLYPLSAPFVILPSEAVATSEGGAEETLWLAATTEQEEPSQIPAKTMLHINEELILVAADLRTTDTIVIKNAAGDFEEASTVLMLPADKPIQALDFVERDYPELQPAVTVLKKSCELPTPSNATVGWYPEVPEEMTSFVAPTDYPWTTSLEAPEGLSTYDRFTFQMCLKAYDSEARSLGARLVDPEQLARSSGEQLTVIFQQTQQLNTDLLQLLEALLSPEAAKQLRPALIQHIGPTWISLPGGVADLNLTEDQLQSLTPFIEDDLHERIENLLLLKAGQISRDDLQSQMAGLLVRQEQEIRAFLTDEQIALIDGVEASSPEPATDENPTIPANPPTASATDSTPDSANPAAPQKQAEEQEEEAPVRIPRIAPAEEFTTPFYLTLPFMLGALVILGLVMGGVAYYFMRRK